ncbi:MAG: DUF4838 domain-containing protein [Pirellulaceae bacterium]|jgi:hypothetical protein|nr:DUF4838 domain-containing protein [Pirellulaceae bacterium]
MLRVALVVQILTVMMGSQAMAATLAANGKSPYTIVVATDAIAAEQTAARELQSHLTLVTGAELPIVTEAAAPAGNRLILVGQTAAFRTAFPDEDLASLMHDGIILRTAGDRLYLLGGQPRGTLYAVYTFLEDIVGVRWWGARPDETFIPTRPTLDIPDLNRLHVPALQYREAFYRCAFDGVYAARSKCNGHFVRVAPEYGGHYNILGWCHTFYQLLPPDKYFAEHPEWYSEINGRRTFEGAQLCLTNDQMRAELTQQALEWLRKDPQAGMISISQNDWGGACQCAQCKAWLAEEGSESGPLIRFVNAVAADIENEFPGTLVETLAYAYTRQPPRLVKPRRNVLVRLCSIEASSAQPLETGVQNESFRRDIEGWCVMAPQLYIWNYVTNFANYIIPHPNWRVLGPDIRYFVHHKCIGLFEQGDAGCSVSDFPELRAWLIAHLMWDPSQDDQALITEFMQGYYGAAAEPLLAYMTLLQDRLTESGAYLPCYMQDTSPWMDLKTANKAAELLSDAAERVQDDPVRSARVRRARLPLDHNWIQRYKDYKRLAAMTGAQFLGPHDLAVAVDEFITTCHSFDADQFREGGPFAAYEPVLRGMVPPPGKQATAPKEAHGLTSDRWLDCQQDEFNLHGLGHWVTIAADSKASDAQAARMPATHNQWATQYPFPDGLGQFGTWRCYVVARCDAKVTSGNAFQIGLYDAPGSRNIAEQMVTIEQSGDGEYHTFDLGSQDLKGGMYFWIAPLKNPDQVDAVYVDRVFLVRER